MHVESPSTTVTVTLTYDDLYHLYNALYNYHPDDEYADEVEVLKDTIETEYRRLKNA